ncbi:hypothetical protein H5410_052490 [Solanum commersonii]|uniref:Uncharacterized protein n=1 Tax=Solanum commersonii TaxID=4109 RepID=A0A9J5X2C0_SOLCO|nr:hypothetical protein H5410_052490 [Solanum commersonii]
MAPLPAPYSGTSTLALVARASAFTFGLAYGSVKHKYLRNPLGWPGGLGLGRPYWRSQVRNPLPRGLPSRSSSSHRVYLVRVISLVWFASYRIEARVLPYAQPKGSGCGFPL